MRTGGLKPDTADIELGSRRAKEPESGKPLTALGSRADHFDNRRLSASAGDPDLPERGMAYSKGGPFRPRGHMAALICGVRPGVQRRFGKREARRHVNAGREKGLPAARVPGMRRPETSPRPYRALHRIVIGAFV